MSTLVEGALNYLRSSETPVRTVVVGSLLVMTVEHVSIPLGVPSVLSLLSMLVLIGYVMEILRKKAAGRDSPPTFGAPFRLLLNGARTTWVLTRYVLSRTGYRYLTGLPRIPAIIGISLTTGFLLLALVMMPLDWRLALYDSYRSLFNAVLVLLGFPPYDERTAVPIVIGPPVIGVGITLVIALYGLPAALVIVATQRYYDGDEFVAELHGTIFEKRYVYGWLTLFALLLIDMSAGVLPLTGAEVSLTGSLDILSIGSAFLGAAIDFYILVAVAYVFGDVVRDPNRGPIRRNRIRSGWQTRLPEFVDGEFPRSMRVWIRLQRRVYRIKDAIVY